MRRRLRWAARRRFNRWLEHNYLAYQKRRGMTVLVVNERIANTAHAAIYKAGIELAGQRFNRQDASVALDLWRREMLISGRLAARIYGGNQPQEGQAGAPST